MTKIAVIGGGPGGYVAAIRAAQLGAEVTLIEKSRLGGTCLNVGCIPTKALLSSAHLYESVKEGKAQGVIAEPFLDFSQVQKNKAFVVSRLVSGVGGLLKANHVRVIQGTASFEDQSNLVVTDVNGEQQTLSSDKIIIASGSIPVIPPIPGVNIPQCIDSTQALSLESVPSSMLIIGGGVIGLELATAYHSFGTKITVVEMTPEILPMMDAELVQMLRKKLKRIGIEVITGAKVASVEEKNGIAYVQVEQNGITTSYTADKVLVSVGRRTDTEALNLEAAGIRHDRGRIQVDKFLLTNLPNVYAIGDCLGKIMLAHVASAQGEAAAEHAMGHLADIYSDKTIPSCVYTDPELATVGLTEEKAKEAGIDYIVGRFPLAANGKALIMNGGEGAIKIIADAKYHEVLGVHILGPRATDLITEGALAIRLEATLEELITTIHAHPTIGEAVRETALAAERRAIHIPN